MMNNNNNNNNTNPSSNSNNNNQQNRPTTASSGLIQPGQVNQLAQALKREIALAKAAGDDQEKAKQHYTRAGYIKQVLLNYQRERFQQQGQSGQPGQLPQPPQLAPQPATQLQTQPPLVAGGALGSFSAQSSNANMQSNRIGQQLPQGLPASLNQPILTPSTQQPLKQSSPPSASTPGVQLPNNTNVTIENYNQVNSRLGDFERRIQQLEANKKINSTPEQVIAIEKELTELKFKYKKYQSFAIYLRKQLSDANNNGTSSPQVGTPGLRTAQDPQVESLSKSPSLQNKGIQSLSQPDLSKASSAAQSPSISRQGRSASPATTSSNNNKSGTPGPPPINLSGITKQSVASLPISSSINVKPPTAITLKTGNNRATLSGGIANGIGSILGSPAITKIPTYDLSATVPGGSIPDNGGRVLTKRKLSELVNTIGVDEGDGKTNVDGDVEELLLDLADEFISSVTGFACRLAKHRKVDSIDVRDIQLHLERNWNIRIPGYAMDEIRATRKWQPNPSYTQKLSGVEISKSVNGNMN